MTNSMRKQRLAEVRKLQKIAGIIKEDRFYAPDYLLQMLGSEQAVQDLISQYEEDHANEEDPEGDNARDYLLSIDNEQELKDVLKDYLPSLQECDDCGRDWNHGHDHEAGMAKNELRDMISNASKIDHMVKEGDNLPGWVSAYISLAADYMHSVAEYLAGESSRMEEPGAGYGEVMYEGEDEREEILNVLQDNYGISDAVQEFLGWDEEEAESADSTNWDDVVDAIESNPALKNRLIYNQ